MHLNNGYELIPMILPYSQKEILSQGSNICPNRFIEQKAAADNNAKDKYNDACLIVFPAYFFTVII